MSKDLSCELREMHLASALRAFCTLWVEINDESNFCLPFPWVIIDMGDMERRGEFIITMY